MSELDLSVQIGRLRLPNPVMVASGTFGYVREMVGLVDVNRLGALIPKTVTKQARAGNPPWRTVETAAGMLNSIGLDNDGIDAFLTHHLPYLREFNAPTIVSVAGRNYDEFVEMAGMLQQADGVAAIELNISCPNVSGGVDFGTSPQMCERVTRGVKSATELPILTKLTPNVTDITEIAQASADAGADGISLINTVLGMALDWRRRRPLLGRGLGGLSGPAVKPIALRAVYQAARVVDVPLVGIGGIATVDDAMEFFVAGASAIQVGTANFYDPTVSTKILDGLPAALLESGASCIADVVGTLDDSVVE